MGMLGISFEEQQSDWFLPVSLLNSGEIYIRVDQRLKDLLCFRYLNLPPSGPAPS